ncbi:MAG: response regulator, partial [Rickettsiales bacterium]|nr:response regulator [Rickettsiales bacterium]
MQKPNLKDVRILIADHDVNLGVMLLQVLQRMGFSQLQLVRDGYAALETLEREPKDILMTEMQLQGLDGLALTNQIRQSDKVADRLIPIIMMTAKAEKQDVEAARDAGITEFVVKPYNSLTIFKRIQQVIDNPRAFLLSQEYVGPDRRRRSLDFNGSERRTERPEVIPSDLVSEEVDAPKLIMPEHILKKRIGLRDSLDTIITPQVLMQAQAVIDNLKDESMLWIQTSLRTLNDGYRQLLKDSSGEALEHILAALLALKAHSGTFGYLNASQLAQQLYHFMR